MIQFEHFRFHILISEQRKLSVKSGVPPQFIDMFNIDKLSKPNIETESSLSTAVDKTQLLFPRVRMNFESQL